MRDEVVSQPHERVAAREQLQTALSDLRPELISVQERHSEALAACRAMDEAMFGKPMGDTGVSAEDQSRYSLATAELRAATEALRPIEDRYLDLQRQMEQSFT